jgi:hypothetical protein
LSDLGGEGDEIRIQLRISAFPIEPIFENFPASTERDNSDRIIVYSIFAAMAEQEKIPVNTNLFKNVSILNSF